MTKKFFLKIISMVLVLGISVSMGSVTSFADDDPEILSGKVFESATGASFAGDKLTDGDIYTFNDWYGFDVYVNMGRRYNISKMEIYFRSAAQESERNYIDFQLSDDRDSGYETIYSIGATKDDSMLSVSFTGDEIKTGRYFKIASGEGNDLYNLLTEVKLYGQEAAPEPIRESDVSTGKPVKASGYGNTNYEPDKANDGQIGTMWECDFHNLSNIWWQVDLGNMVSITKVEISGRSSESTGERANFEILASNDEGFGTYVTIGTQGATPFDSSTGWFCEVTEADRYRYVRLRKTAAEYFVLPEITVYGFPEDIVITNAQYSQETLDLTEDITFSGYIENNTLSDQTVSVLLVLMKNGVVLDLDYATYTASPQTNDTEISLTLLARAAGDGTETVKAFIFDNFINLYSVGSLQAELK